MKNFPCFKRRPENALKICNRVQIPVTILPDGRIRPNALINILYCLKKNYCTIYHPWIGITLSPFNKNKIDNDILWYTENYPMPFNFFKKKTNSRINI